MELLRSCSLVSLGIKVTPSAPFLLWGEKISFCQREHTVYFMFAVSKAQERNYCQLGRLFFIVFWWGGNFFIGRRSAQGDPAPGPSKEKKGVGGKVNYLEMMPSPFDSQPVNACTDSTRLALISTTSLCAHIKIRELEKKLWLWSARFFTSLELSLSVRNFFTPAVDWIRAPCSSSKLGLLLINLIKLCNRVWRLSFDTFLL